MILPNFLVIGAAKSGTFSLFNYLRQHPQIYMSPVKEPKYFAFSEGEKLNLNGPGDMAANRRVTTDLESYCKLFEGVTDEVAIGECSPSYLYCQEAPERIKNVLPDVKVIAILRNPVERAHSNFLHLFSTGREPLNSFEQALKAEEERIKANWEYFWHYKNQGFYYAKLKHYFDIFDSKQIKVYLYEDYQSDPMMLLKDIFTFLNVNSNFVPNIAERYHVAKVPKSLAFHNLVARPNPVRLLLQTILSTKWQKKIGRAVKKLNQSNIKPEIDPLVKNKLILEYREDIIKLQDLIRQDLGNWLNN
jgi:hypothetical protein